MDLLQESGGADVANKRAKQVRAKGQILTAASADGDELVLEVSAAAGPQTLRVVLGGVEAAENLYDALGEWLTSRLDAEDAADRSAA